MYKITLTLLCSQHIQSTPSSCLFCPCLSFISDIGSSEFNFSASESESLTAPPLSLFFFSKAQSSPFDSFEEPPVPRRLSRLPFPILFFFPSCFSRFAGFSGLFFFFLFCCPGFLGFFGGLGVFFLPFSPFPLLFWLRNYNYVVLSYNIIHHHHQIFFHHHHHLCIFILILHYHR